MDKDGFRQDLIDGWLSFCQRSNPALGEAWEFANDPSGFTKEESRLKGLVPLLGPVAFLVKHGNAESIGRNAATLHHAADVLMKTNPGWTDATVKGLAQQMDQFRMWADSARKAEEHLNRHGWCFDSNTKKIRAVSKHKGRHLLTLCIQSLAAEFGTDIEGRRKIAEYLSPYFMEKLDPAPRGNVARALENIARTISLKR